MDCLSRLKYGVLIYMYIQFHPIGSNPSECYLPGPLGAYNGKQCVVGDRDSVNDKISVQITNGKEVKNIKVNIENLCTLFPRMVGTIKSTVSFACARIYFFDNHD